MSTISEDLLKPSLETDDKPVRALSSDDIQKAEEAPPQPAETTDLEAAQTISETERAPASLGHGGFGRVDEHSGAYSYGVQVFIPTPQNGAPTPRISIVYNSMASKSPSLIGAGWRLELGRVMRVAPHDTRVNFKNDQGSEPSKDYFVLEINGHSHTLVKVRNHPHRFRLKIEQSYAEAVRFLSDKIDPISKEPEIDYWEVYLADGSRFRYGVEGVAGEEEVPGELRNKLWNLMSVENSYGQKVIYEYDAYKGNGTWKEMAYSYPRRVKVGVTPDGEFCDSIVEFIYSDEPPPSEVTGYYNLGIDYTGRENEGLNGWTCIIWRRLVEVRTLYRDENGDFQPARSVRINARRVEGAFQVEQLEEIGYKDGKAGTDVQMPPHQLTYISKGEANPALMVTATNPLGEVDEVTYGLATELDKGTAKAVDDFYLVETLTERAGDESWTTKYHYWDGKFYTPFEEYRGHSRVDVIDLETNQRTETYFEQTGLLNGHEKEKITYDTSGKKVSHSKTAYMVLDYRGGRYLSFVQQTVATNYAEDGETVLSALESIVPPVGHPDFPKDADPTWGYALDEFGNILTQVNTCYEGDPSAGRIVRQSKTDCTFKNVTELDRTRLIGMLLDKKDYARHSPGDPWVLINRIQTEFNDKGQAVISRFHFDRDDPQKVHLKSSEYDPFTGKITRVYRYAGKEKLLAEETRYYEDGPFRFLVSHVINAKGHAEQRERYDLRYRYPTLVTYTNGMTAETDFDAYGRPTSEIFTVHKTALRRGAPKVSVRYKYVTTPEERSIETVNIHTKTRSKQYFDQLNRKIRMEGTGFKGQPVIETLAYDHRSREVHKVSEPYFEGASPAGFTITERNDARLRPTKITHAGGHVVRYEYQGLTTRAHEDVFERQEDGTVGKLLQTRLVNETTKNALGQVVKQAEGLDGQPTHYEIYNTYDLDNRLIEVRDNLDVLLRRVDYHSRLDELAVSTWDVSLGRGELEYDELGRLKVSRQDFKASLDRVTTLVYDEMDRIVEQVVEDTIDHARRIVHTTYDREPFGIGAVAKEETIEISAAGRTAQREEWDYDEFGNPTGKTFEWEISWPALGVENSFRLQTAYRHDGEKGGRLERLTYPALDNLKGGEATYEYDDLSGYLTAVRFGGKEVWQAGSEGFNASGGVINTLFGNGVNTRYDYDPKTGLVVRSLTGRGQIPLLDQHILYDTSGDVRRRNLKVAVLNEKGDEQSLTRGGYYDYDDKGQLTKAVEDERHQAFSYERNGSRLRLVENGAETVYHYEGRSPHQVTQLTGAQDRSLSYDRAGNLVTDINGETGASRHLLWSPANRLHQVEVRRENEDALRHLYYGYSPDNERVFMYDSLNERLVLYGDDQFELEWRRAEDRTILRSHLSNGARRFATVEQESGQQPRIYYLHRDQIQSVTLVTDEAGEIASTYDYEPFGRIAQHTGAYQSDLLFMGHRGDLVNDEGFSLYDFIVRWYDPVLAIFISPDPTQDTKNIAFGLNRYVFVGNNPLSHIDPTGREEEKLKEILIVGPKILKDIMKSPALQHAYKKIKERFPNAVFEIQNEWDAKDLLNKAHHPIYFEHGSKDLGVLMKQMQRLGEYASQAGNTTLTAMMCNSGCISAQGAYAPEIDGKVAPRPLLYTPPQEYGGKAFLLTDGSFGHGPADASEEVRHSKFKVDLDARFEKPSNEKVFTNVLSEHTGKALQLETPSTSGSALKIVKGMGGPVLKTLDVYSRVQDGMELHEELKNGNYWNAAKKGTAMALDYIPNVHLQVFMTAYNITDTFNKATGNYIPNKIADALLSVGADKLMAKAEAVASKVSKWFKSWW